ncbi:hypothetical protein [Aurantiacibacter hainanensis]|uniref:hypothetical protein n=1 Tax=Aurantiacibacter hainanensis TaxID=3076114 RepID=UPI0030C70351
MMAALGLAIASCGDSSAELGESQSVSTHPAGAGAMQNATLGPLTYQFDQSELTAADVDIRIPPDYQTMQSATKLIPEARAFSLGEENCSYGESGLVSECSAEQEAGLTLALLPRPVGEYREAFEEAGPIADELEPTQLNGIDGFSFTAEAEGAGTEYRFFGIDERTILLARTFDSDSTDDAGNAIEKVIRTLSRSVDDQLEEDS